MHPFKTSIILEVNELIASYHKLPQFNLFKKLVQENSTKRLELKNLYGSSYSLFSSSVIADTGGVHLFTLQDKELAAYFQNDLSCLLDEDEVFFLPSSYKRSVQYKQAESSNLVLRTAVLNAIRDFKEQRKNIKTLVIVTYPEALMEKVATESELKENTLRLNCGENISIKFIEEVLIEYGFTLVDFVYEPGQYSVRGSIVDVFSFSNELPYRIDFFDDEVDTIRTFDIETQLSKQKLESIYIVPNIQNPKITGTSESLLDFLPEETLVWIESPGLIFDAVKKVFENTDPDVAIEEDQSIKKNNLILDDNTLQEKISTKKIICLKNSGFYTPDETISFNTISQPVFNKNFELLANELRNRKNDGYENYILSDSENQFDRLLSIFESIGSNIKFNSVLKTLHEGFIDHDLKICCFTDHQIFDRYHKFKINRNFDKKSSLSIKELTNLNPGDYVVHADHGIGIFGGLERIELNGKQQETIRLVFRDNDVLFVNIHSLHRISKYRGKDGEAPKVYKLGTGAWQKLKQITKKKVKDIAKDLIALYAKRVAEEGFSFSPDTYLQQELEASFIYEDTPDQEKATNTVKQAMERVHPMDCLVCGDVGFGKTEVAIRAAFKAVADNKQVAVLVPTTILALQHYKTFSERLKDFPCNVDYISRLKKTSAQKEVLKKLASGELDIIIGTHRLIGKDIKFKDLGLLIVDEEQKFGVAVKEKLKSLKVNVDTLTMTATPIPRTLQFSLMGARDLAIINTPPPNRHPIITELHTLNEEIIKEGIEYELSRGGQVFFINNRVQNIYEIEAFVQRTVPNVKTIVAHGQMDGPKLEKIMLDFIAGDYDVLIATSIIESGLDIPNANTIFVNNAHHFGLSDLHQLRGRVGRSNKKAFCYLLAPPITAMTPEARRRLKAIEEFSELGSGFNIAMQDLDIRGAGNLLGGEQSGFIVDMGFETYQRILNEAMLELKENEFKDLFADEKKAENEPAVKVKYIADCLIDTDLEVLFPDSYVQNITERLKLYRELDNIEEEQKLQEFEQMLIDRFGNLPKPTKELFQVVRLRWKGIELGMEKIILKNEKLICYFISNQDSAFYQSPVFSGILSFLQTNPLVFQMKEGKKLTLSADKIKDISEAIELLNRLVVTQ